MFLRMFALCSNMNQTNEARLKNLNLSEIFIHSSFQFLFIFF